MSKFLATTVLGLVLLVSVANVQAGGPVQGPMKSAAAQSATRETRSYSYEPGLRSYSYGAPATYRTYGRSNSRSIGGGFSDATTKGRGNY